MNAEIIDYRSDTVTRPSAGMLEYMFKAAVGDDVFGEDPSLNELENRLASLFGKEAGNEYCIGTRKRILNDKPIIGPYGVNKEGSGDMYYKGGNMIHNIRHIINNDSLFRNILRGLNTTFYHQTVTTEQIEAYINKHSGIDFQKVFDQYLRTTQIPTLTFVLDKSKQQVTLHWTNCVEGFNMPVTIPITSKRLTVTTQEQSFPLTKEELDWFTAKNLLNTYYIRL